MKSRSIIRIAAACTAFFRAAGHADAADKSMDMSEASKGLSIDRGGSGLLGITPGAHQAWKVASTSISMFGSGKGKPRAIANAVDI